MCNKCGECCKSMRFQLFDADHYRWAELHGVTIVEDDGFWVEFPIKCKKLKNNRCTIYEDRPEMCKEFSCEL